MHGDTYPESGHRKKVTSPQTDGRKPLPHIITAIVSIAATLGLTALTNINQGPPGQSGTTTVVTKVASQDGFCAYFGKDSAGKTRFQVFPPKHDSSGPYCTEGDFVSVVVPGT